MLVRLALAAVMMMCGVAMGQERPFYRGADVSMLYELEQAGRVYRNAAGEKADAIAVLAEHGVNLFRLRVFVNPPPSSEFDKVWGATQDLAQVKVLARRMKAVGVPYLLDLHYSDTWADPQHQNKPKAWKDLPYDALKQKVYDYTVEVLRELDREGLRPEMVQVGNEITPGILWPDGKVVNIKPEEKARQWEKFGELLAAGIRGVRDVSKEGRGGRPILVMIHIHGGGKPGLPKWFFETITPELKKAGADFDIIGISAYPAWGDDVEQVRKNIAELKSFGKMVIAAETSYPYREMRGISEKDMAAMDWPMTVEGQGQFVREFTAALKAENASGWIWWYPEAVKTPGRFVWREGAEALFDDEGVPLPALRDLNK